MSMDNAAMNVEINDIEHSVSNAVPSIDTAKDTYVAIPPELIVKTDVSNTDISVVSDNNVATEQTVNRSQNSPADATVRHKTYDGPRKVFITNKTRVVRSIVNNLNYTVHNLINVRYSPSSVEILLEKALDIIKNSYNTDIHTGKVQSVAWHYINEHLNEKLMPIRTKTLLNNLIFAMSFAFDTISPLSRQEDVDTSIFDVARCLNETMKLCDYSISFHPGMYGNTNNNFVMRIRISKSAIRRPIAKAELVLAWFAYVVALTPDGYTHKKHTHRNRFIDLLGFMLNVFIKQEEFVKNGQIHKPSLPILSFIRLLEIVYVCTVPRHGIYRDSTILYNTWFDRPDRFDCISDFMDIRISSNENSLWSKLSRLPRGYTTHSTDDTYFYNPVRCAKESPIYAATEAWIETRRKLLSDTSFRAAIELTARASFAYESKFAYGKGITPVWLDTSIYISVSDDDEENIETMNAFCKKYSTELSLYRNLLSEDTPRRKFVIGAMLKYTDGTQCLGYLDPYPLDTKCDNGEDNA